MNMIKTGNKIEQERCRGQNSAQYKYNIEMLGCSTFGGDAAREFLTNMKRKVARKYT